MTTAAVALFQTFPSTTLCSPMRAAPTEPKASIERHGPCNLYLEVLFEVIKRLTPETKRHIGKLLASSGAWQRGREEVKWLANAIRLPSGELVRDIANPMSPWQLVELDMQDLLVRTHTLTDDLAANPLETRADEVLMELAQGLLIWDWYRPRMFEALYAYLGRIAYEPPLIGNRAPAIVAVWMLGPHYSGSRENAVSLIGGRDLEDAHARVRNIVAIEERYRRRKAGRDTEADQP